MAALAVTGGPPRPAGGRESLAETGRAVSLLAGGWRTAPWPGGCASRRTPWTPASGTCPPSWAYQRAPAGRQGRVIRIRLGW